MRIIPGFIILAILTSQPAFGKTQDGAEAIGAKIGELAVLYSFYTACAGTELAKNNFGDFKYNMGQFFGEPFATDVQTRYDAAAKKMDDMPPSKRRKYIDETYCVAEEQDLVKELKVLFDDLEWHFKRTPKQPDQKLP